MVHLDNHGREHSCPDRRKDRVAVLRVAVEAVVPVALRVAWAGESVAQLPFGSSVVLGFGTIAVR